MLDGCLFRFEESVFIQKYFFINGTVRRAHHGI